MDNLRLKEISIGTQTSSNFEILGMWKLIKASTIKDPIEVKSWEETARQRSKLD